MATVTIGQLGPRFGIGTNVSVYARNTNWPGGILKGAPSGAAAAGPVAIDTNGNATFAGLAPDTEYVIYAAAPDRYTGFRTDPGGSSYGARDVEIIQTRLPTYQAVYRVTPRPYALSNAFGAAGRKQFATIHHAAAALKLVKLRHVWIALESASAAAIVMADLVRITTAPATGNPAITPAPRSAGDAAAEATCLALPTTAATEDANVLATQEWNLGITGAGSTANPPPGLTYYDLLDPGAVLAPDDKGRLPEIRPGVLEGWAVTLDASALATVKALVVIEFTEE